MNVKYRVTLDTSERAQLAAMVLGGKGAHRRLKRAQILLAADSASTDEKIARNVAVGTSTVYRTKQRFVEEGLARALSELPRPGAERKLGVGDESLLVAVACSKPPEEDRMRPRGNRCQTGAIETVPETYGAKAQEARAAHARRGRQGQGPRWSAARLWSATWPQDRLA